MQHSIRHQLKMTCQIEIYYDLVTLNFFLNYCLGNTIEYSIIFDYMIFTICIVTKPFTGYPQNTLTSKRCPIDGGLQHHQCWRSDVQLRSLGCHLLSRRWADVKAQTSPHTSSNIKQTLQLRLWLMLLWPTQQLSSNVGNKGQCPHNISWVCFVGIFLFFATFNM